MTLGLETLKLRTFGNLRVEHFAEIAGPLTMADVQRLEVPRETTMPPLKRITDRHHALARAIASGIKDTEVALMHGYTLPRISMLKTDPAFADLIAAYREQITIEYRGVHQKLAGVTSTALDQLEDRLEQEDLPVGQLLEIVKMGADRTGAGPSSTSVQVNIHANLADRMRAAREQAMAASKTSPVLELEVKSND